MSEFTSPMSSQSASWFEFLLNPTLLDTFLTEDNLGNRDDEKIDGRIFFCLFSKK